MDVVGDCAMNERVIMLGDFNAWVGVARNGCKSVLGKFGDKRVNENVESDCSMLGKQSSCDEHGVSS